MTDGLTLDRSCRFCGSKMEAAATKCASCGEWRPEVKNSRNLAWTTSIAFTVAMLMAVTNIGNLTLVFWAMAAVLGAMCFYFTGKHSRQTGNWFWI